MTLIAVSDDDLADLRSRLRGTRWATPWPESGWAAGTDQAELRRLVEYWADGYDWRAHETAVNALPSHFADLAGTPVHYLRFDGEHPDALPIVLTHGWPSSFLELVPLARRLATPSAHDGRAEDAFTVIVPSLPGFTFSPQRPGLPSDLPTHELWHRLMHDELGLTRYAAHGGDLGAGISSRLGQTHPEAVVGIHVLAVADPEEATDVTPAEQAHRDTMAAWDAEEGAYGHQQRTRPVTLAHGLSDSPAGLLAWLVEKYRAWTETMFDDDVVLTQASLYWFTNTIASSFRPYHERHRGMLPPATAVPVPTAVALFPKDMAHPPRSWAERTHHVTRYTELARGGHFAAHEQPALLGADITEFFRPLRPS